ncbi:YsnF/AvaK domain-containing protein [Caballeronia sp. EK]|uniref:YsnF/AvaK domain-containing protein n=1 Tax=Caballeronia sp. EK TaxID=2767469 RepID=UPI0016559C42|nr:YsnF/AvaK domain-containing protein [Caballeronia sp. EK]MBC8643020.1 YsnF/AvaK domain-containing protein [Caballeronia sp. EK]
MSGNDEPTPNLEGGPATLIASEERLALTAREQETGALRVRTVTHTELHELPVLLHSRTVQVERVAVNRFVDAQFAPHQEGDTLIVPVFEYVPVTELKLLLKEEVRITTVVSTETDVHVAEVQRQQVVVERRVGSAGDWIADPAIPSSGVGDSVSNPAG